MRATTSSTPSPVVSSVTAPVAARSGAVLALAITLVAQGLLGEDGGLLGAQLTGAPARALGRARRQEDLQRRVRRHDRTDVAPLGHPVALGDQASLARHERLAHARVRGHARGRLGDLGGADLLGHVTAVEQHAHGRASPGAPASSICAPRARAAGCCWGD